MSDEPWIKKMLRFGLIGGGVSSIVSAVISTYSAFTLIEPSDEEAIGLSRNQFLAGYGVMLLCGLTLVWLGFRRRR